MSDGTRTRDHRDHNPELYQLSYAHHERLNESSSGSRACQLWSDTPVSFYDRVFAAGWLLGASPLAVDRLERGTVPMQFPLVRPYALGAVADGAA